MRERERGTFHAKRGERKYPSGTWVNLAGLRGKFISPKRPKTWQERFAKFLPRETVKKESSPSLIAVGADVMETQDVEYVAKALTNIEKAKKELMVAVGLAPKGTREVSR